MTQSFQHFHVLIYFGDVVEHENDEFQEHKASDLKTKEKRIWLFNTTLLIKDNKNLKLDSNNTWDDYGLKENT